ncbi:MAG TPA: hypothetical protein VGC90_02795, partial [Candidatus Limnocylindrales bacterium]
MTRHGRSLPHVVAVLAATLALSGCATIAVPPTVPPVAAPVTPPAGGAVAADRDLGPADPAERIRFSLDLRMPGLAALDA